MVMRSFQVFAGAAGAAAGGGGGGTTTAAGGGAASGGGAAGGAPAGGVWARAANGDRTATASTQAERRINDPRVNGSEKNGERFDETFFILFGNRGGT
jgi:hypothetical protein